ncbi:MAG: hypothetical protein JOY62_11470 [Acidobacteriaceae bacterium]|nr:hypothetical protein [Acidobacteriaceae bacterium]MBV9780579.1 hypothetical protein [Acidobacteriaceae bacterium]
MQLLKTAFACTSIISILYVIYGLTGNASSPQTTVKPNFTVLYNLGSTPGNPQNPVTPGVLVEGRDGSIYTTSPAGGANGNGTIFKFTPAGTLTVLYSFDGAHGAAPQGGLTLGTDGNFYGTTIQGGSAGYGTVFKITPAGSLTVLYNFTNGTDGGQPYAAPIQAADGNFYGTTTSGGEAAFGTIYQITPVGKLTTIHAFTGSYTNAMAPLLQGNDRNLYGTTFYGGSYNVGSIFRVSPSGTFTSLYTFNETNGGQPFAALIQGTDGNFYGTTSLGSTHSSGLIFQLMPSGVLNKLYAFGTIPGDGAWPYASLIQASDGNLYGATAAGGIGDGYGTIFEFQLSPQPAYSLLIPFTPNLGENPQVPLLQHTNGVLYGLTNYGGTGNQGTIYSLNLQLPPFARLISTSGQVGSTVEILGQGFTNATAISFGGKVGTVTSQSGTYLTSTVPAGALTGPVTLTTGSNILTTTQVFRVTPKMTSFAPTSGPQGKM